MGIEPTFLAWEANVLPLNYTRNSKLEFYEIPDTSQFRDHSITMRIFYLSSFSPISHD